MSNVLSVQFRRALEQMKETPQRTDYHPEKWVWDHEAYVFYGVLENLSDKYDEDQLKELKLVALFHDIGKIDTTWFREDKGYLVSYGHEKAALPYYDSVIDALLLGSVRKDVVRWLVVNHMKPKFMHNMNESTKQALHDEADELGSDVWEMLHDFNNQDDMRSFMKVTTEEDRMKARFLFDHYVDEMVSRVEDSWEGVHPDPRGDLFLIRGVPGSGKSTAARAITGATGVEIAADDFFVGDDGKYRYNGSKISEAHEWCHDQVKDFMERGVTPVAVHNTFTKRWEMMAYYRFAVEYGYTVHTLVAENRHDSTNIHNVPENKVDEKRENFELEL